MKKLLPVVMLACGLLTAPSFAAEQATGMDKMFVNKAAQGGNAEIMVGKLALQKSKNPSVRSIAQKLVNDHSAANAALARSAAQVKLTLPKGVNGEEKAEYNKLSRLKGEQFDRAFLQAELADHHATAKLFQQEMEHGKSGGLKDFAATYLPKVQMHADMISDAHKAL